MIRGSKVKLVRKEPPETKVKKVKQDLKEIKDRRVLKVHNGRQHRVLL